MDRASAASLRHRLEAIDAETALLHAKITDLAAARRVVVDQLKRVTFPVLDLPVEITSQIFLHYTQHIRIGKRELDYNRPFVLASVCRRWRRIALALHELWANIIISLDSSSESEVAKRKLGLCLDRAGKHCDMDLSFARHLGLEEIFPLVAPTAARWTHCQADSEMLFLDDVRGRFSRLYTLELWNHMWPTPNDSERPLVAFDDAPLLRKVKLIDVSAGMASLPWAQLTDLSLYCNDPMDSEECLEILRQTPNLERLCFRIPCDPLPAGTYPPLRFEKLHDLTLEWTDFNRVAAVMFFDLFMVPALVNFTIGIDNDSDYDSTLAIRDMLQRSDCGSNIRSLTLKTHEKRRLGGVDEILALIPVLDKLTITQIAWDVLESLFYLFAPGRTRFRTATPLPFTEIGVLHLEISPERIPYPAIAEFVSRRELQSSSDDSKAHGLRRFELSIPAYNSDEYDEDPDQGKALVALETLRRISAASGGPEISITAHKDPDFISSDGRLPPPRHTLSD
ncbi:hypothetical protein C8F01DRAFT_282292 [Mycena amicta]|nr:hypothetical protein C8F01DRAFT_282292 [Mycena amicta]